MPSCPAPSPARLPRVRLLRRTPPVPHSHTFSYSTCHPRRKMKEQIFGATTFWVTETRPLAMQTLELGVVVRGNLRGPREAVFKEVCDKVAAMFGEYV